MTADSHPGFRKLISASGVYFLGALAQKSIGFLLLPLYTSLLAPVDYGTLAMLQTFQLICLVFLSFGLPSAIVKCYHRDCDSPADRAGILPVAMLIGFPAMLAGCWLVFANSGWLSRLLLTSAGNAHLVELVALWVFLDGLSLIVLAFFRAREEAVVYVSLSFAQFLLLLVLNVYFVYFLRWGVEGILWGNILSYVFIVLLSVPFVLKRIKLTFRPHLAAPLVSFGLLMVPTVLAGWVMGMSDRYFLRYFGELSEVGIYSVGYKFGTIMQLLIVAPFQLAWPAFSFSISNEAHHKKVYARTLTYLIVASVFVWLALSLLTRPLLLLIVDQGYLEAYRVVPLIVAAYLFNGIHLCVSPGIHIRKKSRYLPVLVVGASLANLLLNLVMVPRFGMMGAACATAISFFLLGGFTVAVANAVYPVSYEYARITKVTIVGLTLYLASLFLQPVPAIGAAVWGVLVLLSFPLLLIGFKLLEADEKLFLLNAFRTARPV